jgi:hypothetical protein
MERNVKAVRLADGGNEAIFGSSQYLFIEGWLSHVWRRAFDRLRVQGHRGIQVCL